MEKLRIIGTEDDVLVLTNESGDRFSLPVDDVLRAQLRRARRERDGDRSDRPRANPRDIQNRVRAGMSAREVAEALGISIEDVARYEGPVLAERDYLIGQALAVPVLVADDLEHDSTPTFGTAVRAKLDEAAAIGEQWTAWKDSAGWTLKLTFTAGEVDHDARWAFDPRRSTLSPLNTDATQLSRQGSLPDGLIPRLRALEVPETKDDSHFDSALFSPRRLQPAPPQEDAQAEGPAPALSAAIKRAPDASQTSAETADLLEALRRRRGQRAAAPEADDAESDDNGAVALFDAPQTDASTEPPGTSDDDDQSDGEQSPSVGDAKRRRRSAMPSWDEIVFGARSEDS